MKVFFYLVPRETATKVDAFAGDNGEPLLKTKIGNKTGNVYRVLTSGSTGRLKTGLDIMVDNPYKSLDKEQVKGGFEPVIFNKRKSKIATYFRIQTWSTCRFLYRYAYYK